MAFRLARAAEASPADCRGARQRHKPHCIRRGGSRRGSGSPGLRLFERPTIESSSAHSRAAAFRCRRRISQGNQLESHGKFYRCRKAREVRVRPLFCVADTLLRFIAVTESPAWSRQRRNTTSKMPSNTLRNTSASVITTMRASGCRANGWAQVRGEGFSVSELKDFTQRRGYIRDADRPGEVTLRDVLLREWEIVQTVKEGVGDCHPLVANPLSTDPALDDEQRKALEALLCSTNTVSLFRGGAGTGKSFVLRELAEQVQQAGRSVVVLAPQRQQVVSMEKAGFQSPTTVASFLLKGELAERAVVVVDEAGQIGGRQMLDLIPLARERNARVILSGDTRQHGAVESSDALRAIERHSGVRPVELHTIHRQDPTLGRDADERTRIRQYRKAVESAAAGKLDESFEQLDKIGAVVSCGLGEQAEKLADEYLRLAEQNASAVVISQTWTEVHRVNSRVRDALKAKGLLGANDTTVQVLDGLDLTTAQKRDERFYPQDAVIVFNQKVREAGLGAKGKLAGILKSSVLVEVDGRFVTVSNKMLDRISVCQPRELPIAEGDRLHLKANRRLASGRRVTNGEIVTAKAVRADGEIELSDGRVLDKSFREFLPGYAVTSYGSQGRTVNYVLFSDSTVKAATNAQQWYVTISRGRLGVRIFTTDKEQLRENVARSGHRPLAMEFASGFASRRSVRLWDRLHGYLLRFGRRAADNFVRLKLARRRQPTQNYEHKITRMLGE